MDAIAPLPLPRQSAFEKFGCLLTANTKPERWMFHLIQKKCQKVYRAATWGSQRPYLARLLGGLSIAAVSGIFLNSTHLGRSGLALVSGAALSAGLMNKQDSPLRKVIYMGAWVAGISGGVLVESLTGI